MQRRIFSTILSTALRSVGSGNILLPTKLHFHLMQNALRSEHSSSTAATAVEKRTDFTDLSSETFGTLRFKKDIRETLNELPEEEDEKDVFDLTNEEGRKTRRPIEFYEKLIKRLLDEKKLVEALDVLESRMLQKDKVNPSYYVYNLLINACAHAGYTEKAFELYQKMKERKVKRTAPTYTGLFNACANSPFPVDAARKLVTLRKSLAEQGVELNVINYNAMIKAYARLKDTYSAFLVADEMLCKGHTLTVETCAFLFQACISDKEAGLRHALLLWHKMRSKKLSPDLYVYNLFIRCIRDCGFGNENDLKMVLKEILAKQNEENKLIESSSSNFPPITISWKTKSATSDDSVSGKMKSENDKETLEENRPNLLAKIPHLGSIIALKEVKAPSDRLLLLGGFKTILKQMKADGVKPSIKTFTQLLDIMPTSLEAEEELLEEIKNYDVTIDIDFCNMLIKKRAMRADYENARNVLNLIQKNYLNPDIVTFGVLAVSCRNIREAEELIDEMDAFGYRLNMPILGTMLDHACRRFNLSYVMYIMKLTNKLKITVSQEYMQKLENLEKRCAEFIKRKKRKDRTIPEFFAQPKFLEHYRMWKEYYDRFKMEVKLHVEPHPYKQFRKPANAENSAETMADVAEEPKTKRTHTNEYRDSRMRKRSFERTNKVDVDETSDGLRALWNPKPAERNDNAESFEGQSERRIERTVGRRFRAKKMKEMDANNDNVEN